MRFSRVVGTMTVSLTSGPDWRNGKANEVVVVGAAENVAADEEAWLEKKGVACSEVVGLGRIEGYDVEVLETAECCLRS